MINGKSSIASRKFGLPTPTNIQFSSISDNADGLVYQLQEPDTSRIAVTVRFGHVIAYRAADEGVLLEYWAHKLADTSHLIWELNGSEFLGWMERVSFKALAVEDGVRHFIVVTASICLEVLTMGEPAVEIH
jgi:hypothetical protein